MIIQDPHNPKKRHHFVRANEHSRLAYIQSIDWSHRSEPVNALSVPYVQLYMEGHASHRSERFGGRSYRQMLQQRLNLRQYNRQAQRWA